MKPEQMYRAVAQLHGTAAVAYVEAMQFVVDPKDARRRQELREALESIASDAQHLASKLQDSA